MIALEKLKILTPLQILAKHVGDLGNLIVAKGFKACRKSNKSQHLVTLITSHLPTYTSLSTYTYLCPYLPTPINVFTFPCPYLP